MSSCVRECITLNLIFTPYFCIFRTEQVPIILSPPHRFFHFCGPFGMFLEWNSVQSLSPPPVFILVASFPPGSNIHLLFLTVSFRVQRVLSSILPLFPHLCRFFLFLCCPVTLISFRHLFFCLIPISHVCVRVCAVWMHRVNGKLARMPFYLQEGPPGTGVSFDVQVRSTPPAPPAPAPTSWRHTKRRHCLLRPTILLCWLGGIGSSFLFWLFSTLSLHLLVSLASISAVFYFYFYLVFISEGLSYSHVFYSFFLFYFCVLWFGFQLGWFHFFSFSEDLYITVTCSIVVSSCFLSVSYSCAWALCHCCTGCVTCCLSAC